MATKLNSLHQSGNIPVNPKQFFTLSEQEFSEFLSSNLEQIRSRGFPKNIMEFLIYFPKMVILQVPSETQLDNATDQIFLQDWDAQILEAISILNKQGFSAHAFTTLKLMMHHFQSPIQRERIYKVVSFESYKQIVQLYNKMLFLIAEKIAEERLIPKEGWTILYEPFSPEAKNSASNVTSCLLLYYYDGRWESYVWLTEKGKPQKPIPIKTHGQYLFLDENLQIVEGKLLKCDFEWQQNDSILKSDQVQKKWTKHVNERLDSKSQRVLQQFLPNPKVLDNKEEKIEQFPRLLLNLLFYQGSPNLNSHESNFNVISTSIDVNHPGEVLFKSRDQHQKFIEDFLTVFSEDIANRAKREFPMNASWDFVFPQSKSDWKLTECLFFTDLLEHYETNHDLITWIVEELGSNLTAEKMKKIAIEQEKDPNKNEEIFEVHGQSIIEELLIESKKEYLEALREDQSKMETQSSQLHPSLIQEDQKRKAELTSTPTSLVYEKKQKKKKKQPVQGKQKIEKTTSDMENTAIQIHLDPKEKEKVRSVFAGNPMKAREFNKLVVHLLKKKMEASRSEKFTQDAHGSHPVIRFKKGDGEGTGITLLKKHGNKDGVLNIQSQKRTLRDLLNM